MGLGIVASGHKATVAGYAGEVLADSPFGYWRHDEASGGTSADEMGAYPAIWAGSGWTRGASPLLTTGYSIALGGAAYATISGAPRPAAITVESLVVVASTGVIASVMDRDDGGVVDRAWQFRTTAGGGVEFLWWTNGGGPYFATSAGSLITAGVPFHLAATYDSGSAKVYLNGTQVASQSCPSSPLLTGTTGVMTLAATQGGAYQKLDGRLDEQAAYSSALSAARILAHAQAGGFA